MFSQFLNLKIQKDLCNANEKGKTMISNYLQNMPKQEYPRPQFVRENWINLNGKWSYEFDFGKSGLERQLNTSTGFQQFINVPFCPESKLSGVEHTDFIEQMFYHRTLDIPASWGGKLILLHFGAVYYECEGFINGIRVGRHFGGSASFEFDITEFVKAGESYNFVLLVKSSLRDGTQPAGKQSLVYESKGCSYTRATGIWQTVWLEAVSAEGLKQCKMTPDLDNESFVFEPSFYKEIQHRVMTVNIYANKDLVGTKTVIGQTGVAFTVKLDAVKTWSPEAPFLYDIKYEIKDGQGVVLDTVESYGGLRKIHIEGNRIFLNNRPIFLRFVLNQGYYEDGIWTAPTDDILKRDITMAMEVGFNGARLHQKVFEPRFHYWADKLGFLTWGESASWGPAFWDRSAKMESPEYWKSVFNFEHEWRDILNRDYNAPSIIAWSPLNETRIKDNIDDYRNILHDIYALTKRLDPTRACNETSGYEHMKTDLWTVHVYRSTAKELKEALFPKEGGVFKVNKLEEGYCNQPYINDEFGGFSYIVPERRKFSEKAWGYYNLKLKEINDLYEILNEEVKAMEELPGLAGFCYTQLTDVEQEQNGLYNYDRTPKGDSKKFHEIFSGPLYLE